MRILALFCSFAVALWASQASAQPKPIAHHKPVTIDRVVAVVNGQIVLWSQLSRYAGSTKDPKKALEALIDEALLLGAAEQARLTVTPKEVDRAVDEIKRRNGITDSELVKELAKQGYSMRVYRAEIRNQILRMRAIAVLIRKNVSITDAMVKQEYTRRATPQSKPFEQMKQAIRNELFRAELDRQTRRWLKNARANAHISTSL